jgi:methionyl-tRNA synthetase
VAAVWDVVDAVNKYLVTREPWKVAKDPARADELASILFASAETLRVLAVLIQPIMPGAAQRLWEQLGMGGEVVEQRVPAAVAWGQLAPGTRTTKGQALFPRLEADEA